MWREGEGSAQQGSKVIMLQQSVSVVGAKVTCGSVKSNSSTVTVSLSFLNPPLIPLNLSHAYGSLISLRGVEHDGLYPLIQPRPLGEGAQQDPSNLTDPKSTPATEEERSLQRRDIISGACQLVYLLCRLISEHSMRVANTVAPHGIT